MGGKSKLSDDSIEKMINAIRLRPVLWNINSDEHKKTSATERIPTWQEVAEIAGLGVAEVKSKWKGLKFQYTKFKNAGMTSDSEVQPGKRGQWQWFKSLDFLCDTIPMTEQETMNMDDLVDEVIITQTNSLQPPKKRLKMSKSQRLPVEVNGKLDLLMKLEEKMATRQQKREEERDRHDPESFEAFFKTLLPHVKKSQKPLQMKIDIMQTVMESLLLNGEKEEEI